VAVTDRTLNSSLSRCKRDVAKDIIFLENDIDFVPDSFSPQARPLCDKESSPPRLTPNLSKKREGSSFKHNVSFALDSNAVHIQQSPKVQVLKEATLFQRVRDMTGRSDEMYNKKFCSTSSFINTPFGSIAPTLHGHCSENSSYPLVSHQYRDPSTSGKVPIHGPRRVVKPGTLFPW